MWFVWLLVALLLSPGAHALPRGNGINGVLPSINAVSPNASTTSAGLATNGQAIVTLTASGSPSSWAIASCSGCTNYFAVDSSGHLTVTATGVSNITAALSGTTYTPIVNATNGTGTGGNVSIPITFYPDGALSAASGATAQVPTLLNGYVTRPPWKVAGVDYGVGPSSSCPTTDWQSISQSGVTVNSGATPPNVTVSQTGVTLDCIDFSLHNGAVVNFAAATNGTVTNSKFGGTNLNNTATCVVNADTSSGGLTVKWNTIDGNGSAGSVQSCLVLSSAAGTTTVQFNWLKNAAQQFFDFNNTSGTATANYQFNLLENGAFATNDHMNWMQWNGGTLAGTIQFNTARQTTAPATNAGEGFQLYQNAGSGTISNPKTNNNVMIAKQASAANTMTYLIHGWVAAGGTQSGTWQSQNNYFDISGATAVYYPGSCTGSISFSGGFNMVSGAGAPTSC